MAKRIAYTKVNGYLIVVAVNNSGVDRNTIIEQAACVQINSSIIILSTQFTVTWCLGGVFSCEHVDRPRRTGATNRHSRSPQTIINFLSLLRCDNYCALVCMLTCVHRCWCSVPKVDKRNDFTNFFV